MKHPDAKPPEWMLPDPEPRQELRKFNEEEFIGWEGRVYIDTLKGWVDNPRIDIPVDLWKEKHANRDPNNDELLEIMIDVSVGDGTGEEEEIDEDDVDTRRSRKNKLLELAKSIRLNGVRVPLIVTHDRRILDGNRRYYANLYMHRTADDDTRQGKKEKKNYETLPIWVLPKSVKPDTEDVILTELNSINDCYVKWPYSVVAKRVYRDHVAGMSMPELLEKYHDKTETWLNTVIEASKLAQEFIDHHGDSPEAKDKAYRKLVWFDELRRSNKDALKKEEFRTTVFDLILDPASPFTSHAGFKRLTEIYENPEAWEILTMRQGKAALKQALFTVDRERYEGKTDVQSRMTRVNKILGGIIEGPGFGLVETETLVEFHELAEQVPGLRMDVSARAERLISLLNGLTSKEIAQLPKGLVTKLGTVTERVERQAKSYRE